MECRECNSENITYSETVDDQKVYVCEDCGEKSYFEVGD